MTLEVCVEGVDLFFLSDGCLQVSFNGAQCPLQVVVLLPQLFEQALLQSGRLLLSLRHRHLLLIHLANQIQIISLLNY